MKQDIILNLEPIKKFIDGIGKDVKKFFGQDKACIIGVGDDGYFYGLGLYQWFNQTNKNIDFVSMGNDGRGLDEEKIRGKKILLIDNDIITGKSYKRIMESMRGKKEKLQLKDIKFAVMSDRTGLADFSVEGYSSYAPWSLERLDGLDLKIIRSLSEDGRSSFVDIAKETGLSPVAIKNRVERLIADGVLKILGLLNMDKVYAVSAHIEIEADTKTVDHLIEKFEKSPLVYHLVRVAGSYNLLVSVAAPNLESIETFLTREIRVEPGVKHLEVRVGELPVLPKNWCPPIV